MQKLYASAGGPGAFLNPSGAPGGFPGGANREEVDYVHFGRHVFAFTI